MSEDQTFAALPQNYRDAMTRVVERTYGDLESEATAAWLEWEAASEHECELKQALDENDEQTWQHSLLAFVGGWKAVGHDASRDYRSDN